MQLLSFHTAGQEKADVSARITIWYGNKQAAVSVSFDDAGMSQYESAWPILEKYNIKGTFSIIGEWVQEEASYSAEPGFFEIQRMGWNQLAELASHGHEISAHGYYHRKYDKYMPVPDLAREMKDIKDLIESRIEGGVFTIHYPYSFASGNIPLAAREAGYLYGRTGLDTLNPASPADMLMLASVSVLNPEIPDSAGFAQWIEQAGGNWMILMYHHFFKEDSKEAAILKQHNVEYTYSITPGDFEKQISVLAQSGYWIAPISEVGKYITQRENTEVRIIRTGKKVVIMTVTDLDKAVYNLPVTLEINIPWDRVRVTGSLNDGVFVVKGKTLYVDVMPEQELIISKD